MHIYFFKTYDIIPSKCDELSKVVLKRNEETLLNNLHKGIIINDLK